MWGTVEDGDVMVDSRELDGVKDRLISAEDVWIQVDWSKFQKTRYKRHRLLYCFFLRFILVFHSKVPGAFVCIQMVEILQAHSRNSTS